MNIQRKSSSSGLYWNGHKKIISVAFVLHLLKTSFSLLFFFQFGFFFQFWIFHVRIEKRFHIVILINISDYHVRKRHVTCAPACKCVYIKYIRYVLKKCTRNILFDSNHSKFRSKSDDVFGFLREKDLLSILSNNVHNTA